jgi:hypothetical protein
MKRKQKEPQQPQESLEWVTLYQKPSRSKPKHKPKKKPPEH